MANTIKDGFKKIRLEWWTGDTDTFEDYLISENATKEDIEIAIDIALATGEDECSSFVEIIKAFGYSIEEYVEKIEVYSFEDTGLNDEAVSVISDNFDRLINKVRNSSKEDFIKFYKQLENLEDEDEIKDFIDKELN